MARWTDLATWRGPTPNCGGAMQEQRGLVIHIAEGYFEGTIAYQKNDASNVSSHFVVSDGAKGQGADGDIAQIVDTGITAWTQRAGNGHWLSVECAGFTPYPLTAAQCESIAQLFARTHREYGVPLQLASNPDGKGLGHHSMGCNWPAGAWGHCDCPGPAIIAQKPAILARAIEIVNGDDDDMTPSQQYIQHVGNYRTDAILKLKLSNTVPAFTATDGTSKWPAFTEACPLGIWAAQQTKSDDEIKQQIHDEIAAAVAELDDVTLTDAQVAEIATKTAAGVVTVLDVPTAQENAAAVIAEIAS